MTRLGSLCLLLMSMLLPCDEGHAARRSPECAVWCEFLFWEPRFASAELPAFREALPQLAAAGAELHMAIRPDRLESDQGLDAKMSRFLRRADELGLGVRAWVILPDELGYWSNDETAEQTASRCHRVMDWIVTRKLRCRWIIVDLEPSVRLTNELARLFRERELLRAALLLAVHLDPTRFETARARYARLVREIHARGFRVMAVTYPHVLDGIKVGGTWLESLFHVPTSGIPWDQVSFMVYRTVFASFLGTDQGPGLVRAYARDARKLFGPGCAIDIGAVGETFYDDPLRLAEDRSAVALGGLNRSHVFSLEGMVQHGGVGRWLTPRPVPRSGEGPDPRWIVSETVRFAAGLLRTVLGR